MKKLAELRIADIAVATGRKIVVKPIDRSPPRKRGARREVMNKVGTGRSMVSTTMFNTMKRKLEDRGIGQRQIIEGDPSSG